jgi:hypothetical protein
LALTPAGRRIIHRFFPQHADAIRHAVGALAPRQQALAARLLRTLGMGAAERRNVKPARRSRRPSG